MNTIITETDGKYIVSLEGELDTAHAIEVEEAMKPLHDVNGKDITIDCSQLEYIASSGLRILLGLLKSAKANGNSIFFPSAGHCSVSGHPFRDSQTRNPFP